MSFFLRTPYKSPTGVAKVFQTRHQIISTRRDEDRRLPLPNRVGLQCRLWIGQSTYCLALFSTAVSHIPHLTRVGENPGWKCCAGNLLISLQKQRGSLHRPLPIHLLNSLVNSISTAWSCWYRNDEHRRSPANHQVATPLAQYQAFTVNVLVKAKRKC